MTTETERILVSLPGEGASLDPNGGLVCKVRAEETGGAYSILELVLGPGKGAPMHVHHREDEIFCVAEGECEIVDSAGTQLALTGSVVRLARGIPHAFRNTGSVPCRLVITAIPGGLEGFFAAINEAVSNGQATPERLGQISREFEIVFL